MGAPRIRDARQLPKLGAVELHGARQLSDVCLNEHYLAIKDDPEKKTEIAEWLGFWKGLFGTATLPETTLNLLAEDDDADGTATGVANEVAAMATAQKLVKRADNIRYYQVPGHQVQIAANAANVQYRQRTAA